MLRFETTPDGAADNGGAPAPDDTQAPAPTATPDAPTGWSGPSQEEWQQTQQALTYLAQALMPVDDGQQPDEDEEIDIGDYVNQLVASRLEPMRPLLDATVKERGEREMKRIFSEAKAEVGDFDEDLAERVAQSFLSEHGGDPVKATLEGAKYAAKVRQAERQAGQTDYQARLQRGPYDDEPAAVGSATKTRPKFKSYDEVTEAWAGETEV